MEGAFGKGERYTVGTQDWENTRERITLGTYR